MAGQSDSPSKICEFYKENKCRFGAECHNLHEGPVNSAKILTKKSKKSTSLSAAKKEIEKSSPKSMKTALDVIKRIQWDEMLPAELFTIGKRIALKNKTSAYLIKYWLFIKRIFSYFKKTI